jgi:hypothetical protein
MDAKPTTPQLAQIAQGHAAPVTPQAVQLTRQKLSAGPMALFMQDLKQHL